MSNEPTEDVSPPCITIVWDPELVTEEEYAELVRAIGDLVRSCGGAGVKLLESRTYAVPRTEPCPRCGGHGRALSRDPLWGEALMPCPLCNGTGRVTP